MERNTREQQPLSKRSIWLLDPASRERRRAMDRANKRAQRSSQSARIAGLEKELNETKEELEEARKEIDRLRVQEASMKLALRDVYTTASRLGPLMDETDQVPSLQAPDTRDVESESPSSTSSVIKIPQTSAESFYLGNLNRLASYDSGCDMSGSLQELGAPVRLSFNTESSSPTLDATPSTKAQLILSDEGFYPKVRLGGETWFDSASQLADELQKFPAYDISLTFPAPSQIDNLDLLSESPAGKLCRSIGSIQPYMDVLSEGPWLIKPPHTPPTSQIENVMHDLVYQNPRETSNELQRKSFPSVSSLLNPAGANDEDDISIKIGRHGWSWLIMPNLPEKVAFMYCMCMFARWLRKPTRSNYLALPEFLRPLPIQYSRPHPIWIDLVIWPEAREAMMKKMDWSQFEIFRARVGVGISVNWTRSLNEIVMAGADSDLALRPEFESHIRRVENWTAPPTAAQIFPFLSTIPSHPDPRIYDLDSAAPSV